MTFDALKTTTMKCIGFSLYALLFLCNEKNTKIESYLSCKSINSKQANTKKIFSRKLVDRMENSNGTYGLLLLSSLFRCRAVFRGNVKTPCTGPLLVNGKNAF